MSTFNWPMQLRNLDGGPTVQVNALVDTGATYSVIPANLLRELGVPVARQARFELGDGRIVDMDIGEARATINGGSVVTQVVFGEDNTTPLLGSYTLEGLLLAVDPYNERLVPTNGLL